VGLQRVEWFYATLALTSLITVGVEWLGGSTYLGLVFKAVKHDEVSAEASGVPVFAVKVLAFGLSAFLAGTCGVLLAAYMRFLTPDLFGTSESFRYLMIAVVGGVGSAMGGLVAALGLTLLPEALRGFGETNVRLLIYGAMVLFVLWFLPSGIGGLLDRLTPRAAARRDVPPHSRVTTGTSDSRREGP